MPCAAFREPGSPLATDEEITEASLMAKNTMGWSTFLNAQAYDYDEFVKEFDAIADHVRAQMAAQS